MHARWLSLGLIVVLLAAGFPAQGAAGPEFTMREQPQPATEAGSEYLLLFSMPPLNAGELPGWLDPEQGGLLAGQLIERQVQRLLPQLQDLAAAGRISNTQAHPERMGITVQASNPDVLVELQALPGIAGVYPSVDSTACSQQAARAFSQYIQSGGMTGAADSLAPQSVGTTNPSIKIQHYSSTAGTFYVNTTPNTPLTLSVFRSGQLIASTSGTSMADGSFSIGMWYISCGSTPGWELLDGDVVQVTANGLSVSSVVASLTAWVDPVTDKVAGITDPGRNLKIELNTPGASPCDSSSITTQSVPAGSGGGFEASFTNFDRRAYAVIYAVDAAGNSTYNSFRAYQFTIYNSNSFSFNWKPGETISAAYLRGSTTLHSWNTTLGPGGAYTLSISPDSLQAGDVINLSSSAGAMSYTVLPFTASLNDATDQITGTTKAGAQVTASLLVNSYLTCSFFSQHCGSATAGPGGAYTISLPIHAGDTGTVWVNDGEGNFQRLNVASTYVLVDSNARQVRGTWPNTNLLTLTLKNSSGVVKETRSNIDPGSWHSFSASFTNTIVTGDKIEVADGLTTRIVSVPNFAPRLSTSAGKLIGPAPNGTLKASLYDFRRTGGISSCQEGVAVSGGAINLAFPGAQIGPYDYANLYIADANGDVFPRLVYAFRISITTYSEYGLSSLIIRGYSETAGATMSFTYKRGATILNSQNVTADATGSYVKTLAWSGDILAGDVLEAASSDGSAVNLTIPNLTVLVDAPGKRIYGSAPPNEPVDISVVIEQNRYSAWRSNTGRTLADGSGNYSLANFAWVYNCNNIPVAPGDTCTSAWVDYYFPSEHDIIFHSPDPADVSADALEPDNTPQTASSYAGIQQHTFQDSGDVDWTKFSVPQADVDAGVRYRLQTADLGPGMDTVLELYGSDGTTLINSNDNSGSSLASTILWQPPAAGTYYVRVIPKSDYYVQYCGAFYRLVVMAEKVRVFIPTVKK